MGRRSSPEKRCKRCWMHRRICICDAVPRVDIATKLLVVLHFRETYQTSNTGHLAELATSTGEIKVYGDFDNPLSPEGLFPEDHQVYALFPGDDARVLSREEVDADGRPVCLVVPDATWRQASRMMKRFEPLRKLPRRVLPPGPPSMYKLRVADDPMKISTFEAIARALGILEGQEIQHRLEEEVFRVMIERSLWARNLLPAEAVTTGLPTEALAEMGRRGGRYQKQTEGGEA